MVGLYLALVIPLVCATVWVSANLGYAAEGKGTLRDWALVGLSIGILYLGVGLAAIGHWLILENGLQLLVKN